MYEDRRYTIFPVSELHKIDFTQVEETSIETVRKSVDETKTFVKWENEMPSCLNDVADKEGPYTHTEMLAILSLPFWSQMVDRLE
jgi:hypothetical protein